MTDAGEKLETRMYRRVDAVFGDIDLSARNRQTLRLLTESVRAELERAARIADENEISGGSVIAAAIRKLKE